MLDSPNGLNIQSQLTWPPIAAAPWLGFAQLAAPAIRRHDRL